MGGAAGGAAGGGAAAATAGELVASVAFFRKRTKVSFPDLSVCRPEAGRDGRPVDLIGYAS